MNQIITILIALVVVAVATPKFGLVAYLYRRNQQLQQELVEDALKFMIDRQYQGNLPSRESLAGKLGVSANQAAKLVEQMAADGLLEMKGMNLSLTPEGEQLGIRIIRAHRLWEKYLADEAKMPLHRIHKEANKLEHSTTAEQLQQMEADMGFPTHDPHGDPIPSVKGRIIETDKKSLTEWLPGETARIIEIEDEPQIAYQQIAAAGLRLGMHIRILKRARDRITISDGANVYNFAPIIAANIQVAPVTEKDTGMLDLPTLDQIHSNQKAEIVSLDESVQGFTRRRFLDLGLTPGASIYPELENFFGEPRAYRIRGTLIALRSDQARQIKVRLQDQ